MDLVGCNHCIQSEQCSKSSYLVQCAYLSNCNYCFGCVGISGKEFCILNESYSRSDYFDLTRKLERSLGA
jgi:hypothetical protein